MWFHHPFRADEWLLYTCYSPSASGSRGLATGRFTTRDGRLVATAVQEGLVRLARVRECWTDSIRSADAGGLAGRGDGVGGRLCRGARAAAHGADGAVAPAEAAGPAARRGGTVLVVDGAAAGRARVGRKAVVQHEAIGTLRWRRNGLSFSGFTPRAVFVGVGIVTTAGIESFTNGDLSARMSQWMCTVSQPLRATPTRFTKYCSVLVDVAPGQVLDIQFSDGGRTPPIPQDQLWQDAERVARSTIR